MVDQWAFTATTIPQVQALNGKGQIVDITSSAANVGLANQTTGQFWQGASAYNIIMLNHIWWSFFGKYNTKPGQPTFASGFGIYDIPQGGQV